MIAAEVAVYSDHHSGGGASPSENDEPDLTGSSMLPAENETARIDQPDVQEPAPDPDSLEGVVPLVYEELRTLARRHRRRSGAAETLDTTGLVHEAYLKLAGASQIQLLGRATLTRRSSDPGRGSTTRPRPRKQLGLPERRGHAFFKCWAAVRGPTQTAVHSFI